MALLDRDIYLRNHIMGVLVSFSGKGVSYANIPELADALTEAVIEGDRNWQNENLCEQVASLVGRGCTSMSEIQKAYEDMLVYGTGAITIEEGEIKHVPTYDQVENALQVFADTAIEGEVVFFDPNTGETHTGMVPKREARILAIDELNQPMNRKQRRIKASKDRRHGKSKN
jgi:hypothetical protein